MTCTPGGSPPRNSIFRGGLAALACAFATQAATAQGTLSTLNGTDFGALAGFSVADAGDVNLDGYPDFIVGAKFGSNGSGISTGSAVVYSGADESVIHEFFGHSSSDFFGMAVSTAGDVDHDGYADVMAGSHQEDVLIPNDGAVRVFSGQTGAAIYTFVGPRGNTDWGASLGDAGDVNMDGYTDIIVGAWRDRPNGVDSGAATVFSGFDGSLLYEWEGDSAGDKLAWSVSGAGDTNLDGYDDIIVGTLEDDNTMLDAGGARLFSGQNGAILHQWDGDSSAGWYGYSVAGLGDINADGYPDMLVSAPLDDSNGNDSGMARAFSGLDYSLIFQADGDVGTRYGWSVADGGDMNDDGTPDAIVGAPWTNSQTGLVHVISGVDGTNLYTVNGPPYSNFGYMVSSAGDANRDGVPDLIAGAPYADPISFNEGSALVVSVECGLITTYGTGCAGSGGLTPALSVTGCMTPGGSSSLDLSNAVGGTTAFLFIGSGTTSQPIAGGCPTIVGPRLPIFLAIPVGGSGPGNGAFALPFRLPISAVSPASHNIQLLVADAAGSGGYSTTNGVQLDIN